MKIKKSKDNPEKPNNALEKRKTKSQSRMKFKASTNPLFLNSEEDWIPLTGSLEQIVTGDLEFDGKATIINCCDNPETNDITNLKYLKDQIGILENELLPKSGGTVSGVWSLNGYTISNLKTNDNYDSLVNLNALKLSLKNKLHQGNEESEISVHRNFKMNGTFRLRGLQDSSNSEDILTLNSLEQITKKHISEYIKTNDPENVITSPIDMSNNRITNLKVVESDGSAVNLDYIQEQTSQMLGKTKDANPDITMDLVFDNKTTISQLGNPKDPKDIMNLRNFLLACENEETRYINFQSASVYGDISLSGNTLSGLETINSPSSAVSVKNLKDTLDSRLNYFSKESLKVFSGNLLFNGQTKVKGLADPKNELDAVNLKTVEQSLVELTQDLVKQKEGVLLSGLDCQGYGIYEVADPTDPADGVNLRTMNREIDKQKILGMTPDAISLEEDLQMGLNQIMNISTEPKQPTDGICSISARNIIKKNFSTHLSLSNNKLQGPLDMNQNRISNTQPGINNGDSVNLGQLKKFSEDYLSIKGNDSLKKIKNNLYLSPSSFVIVEEEPSDPSEAVNLKSAKTAEMHFLSSKRSDIIQGDLIFDNYSYISGIPDPLEETDAVNFRKVKSLVAEEFLKKLDTTKPQIQGHLEISKQGIINLSNPKGPFDAVNLITLKNLLSSKIPLTGMSGNQGIERNFNLQNTYKIKGIKNAETDYEAVNLDCLKETSSKYLSKSSVNTNNEIVLENLCFDGIHGLKEIKDPEQENDLINVSTLKILTKEQIKNVLTEKEDSMNGTLNLNGHKIIQMWTPKNEEDVATLESLKIAFNNSIPISEKGNRHIINSWKLKNGFKISGFNDPTHPTDAVNFKTLNKLKKEILTTSGNNGLLPIQTNIDFSGNRFRNIGVAVNDSDGVSIRTIRQEISKLELISLKNTTEHQGIFSGQINMNSHAINSLALASSLNDLCNLSNLKITSRSFIKMRGNSETKISGNWNLQNHTIYNVSNPKEPGDIVNLETLNKSLKTCLHLTQNNPIITKNISFANQYGFSGLHPATLPKQISTLANFKSEALNLKTKFLNKSNNRLIGNIDMQQHCLSCSKNAIENGDAVSLTDFNVIMQNFISFSSNYKQSINGNIFCNGKSKPTGMRDPIKDSDALTLGHLKKSKNLEYITVDTRTIDNLNLNNRLIKNHGIALQDDDLINLKMLKKMFSFFPLTTNDRKITYDLVLSGNTIQGGARCISDEEALHRSEVKEMLKNAFDDCLPETGGTLSSGMNINGYTVTQGVPLKPTDAITLEELEKRLDKLYAPFISLKGDIFIGDLNLNGNSIILDSHNIPENESDGFSLQFALDSATQSLTEYPQKSNPTDNTTPVSINLSGKLDMTNHYLKSYQESKDPKIALNLKLLDGWLKEANNIFLKKTGGLLIDGLDMNSHKISEVAEGTEMTDGINMQQLENYAAKYLSLKGTTVAEPIIGDLFFDKLAVIKNLKNAFENDHLVNMITLKNTTEEFLKQFTSQNNPNLQGNLYLEDGQLKNLGNPDIDNELCNLEIFQNLSASYLKSSSENVSVAANFVLENNNQIKNIKNPINDQDLINFKTLKTLIQDCENTLYNKNSPILKRSLNMNGYTLKTSSEAEEENEAVSLSEFRKSVNEMTLGLQRKNSSWNHDLDMGGNRIQNVGDPLTTNSLVNLKRLKLLLKNLIKNSSSSIIMKGNVVIDSNSSVEIKNNALNDDEALNVNGLNNLLSTTNEHYLSRENPRFGSTIDMKRHIITAERGTENEDAVIYEQVSKEIKKSFICSSRMSSAEFKWKNGLGIPLQEDSLGTRDILYNVDEGFKLLENGVYYLNFCITTTNKNTLSKISVILNSDHLKQTILRGYLTPLKSLLLSGCISITSPSTLKIMHDNSSEIILNNVSYGIVRLTTV